MNTVSDRELLDTLGLEAGDSVLTVDAHPDDESMTRAELLSRLGRLGVLVHSATATDGEAGTEGDPVWVQAGGRRLEAIRAYWHLGVPLYRQHYFGMRDGLLHTDDNLEMLTQKLGGVIAGNNFKVIFTPGADGFDGHTDHIAVHTATLLTLQSVGPDITPWSVDGDTPDFAIAVDRPNKLTALELHASVFNGATLVDPPAQTAEYLGRYPSFFQYEGFTRIRSPLEVSLILPQLVGIAA